MMLARRASAGLCTCNRNQLFASVRWRAAGRQYKQRAARTYPDFHSSLGRCRAAGMGSPDSDRDDKVTGQCHTIYLMPDDIRARVEEN